MLSFEDILFGKIALSDNTKPTLLNNLRDFWESSIKVQINKQPKS